MRRLLLLPTDKVVGLKKWILTERVVRQLAQDVDEITFDNKDYFDINLLMDSVGREAAGSADSQRLFEEKAKMDHQVKKLKEQLKAAQDRLQSYQAVENAGTAPSSSLL